MQARTEQETLISASINIFQQDDINSFPVLPSQNHAKTPTSPAKGKRTTTISLARPFQPFVYLFWTSHILYEASGGLTRAQALQL